MAYLLGGSFGARTLGSTVSNTGQSYDPVFDEEIDAEFVWNLLPSSYRVLMEDREVFTQTWNALYRYISGRLLDTFQTSASQSLRDTPAFQQRRWVLYDLIKTVDFLTDPELIRTGTSETLTWSEENNRLSGYWGNRYGFDKMVKRLNGDTDQEGSLRWSAQIQVSEADPYAGLQIGYFNSKDSRKIANALVSGLIADGDGSIRAFVGQYGSAGALVYVKTSYVLSTDRKYLLEAAYSARDGVASLNVSEVDASLTSGFGSTPANPGTGIYTTSFRDASKDFDDLGVTAGDKLIIEGDVYLIEAASGDSLVVQVAALPAGVSSIPYEVRGTIQRGSTSIDLPNLSADPKFTVDEFGSANVDLRRVEDGSGGCLFDAPSSSAGPIVGRRARIYGFMDSWSYFDPTRSETLLEVPRLQDKVTAPTYYLYQGTDFDIAGAAFQFREPPTEALWAEYSTYDERVLYKNFGANVSLDEVSSEAYRSRLRGLYYAYFKAPTPYAIRTGVQILLGLPIAEEAGVVESINEAYSGTFGEITVNERGYLYPLAVGTSLSVGDQVSAYQPLCDGVEVKDYISHPEWWVHITNGGEHINEIQKYHIFGIFLNIDAFSLDRLQYAVDFVRTVKPTWKETGPILYKSVRDTVDVDDDVEFVLILNLYDIPCDDPPLIDYDGNIYEGEEEDWRYDQGQVEWAFTSAAMRATGKIYTSARLQGVYSDSEIRPYLTGIATFTSSSTAVSGSGTSWLTEIGSGALTDTYVMAALYSEGSDGETAAGSNTFTDLVTGFSSLSAGDTVTVSGAEHQVVSVDSATQITLDHAFTSDASGLAWEAVGPLASWGTAASVGADDSLTLGTAFSGNSGTYKITLMDPDFREVLYDHFIEACPEEELQLVLNLSPGYQETLLEGSASLTAPSAVVSGSGTDWTSSIGGPGAVSGKYIVDPYGRWHEVSEVVSDTELLLSTSSADALSGDRLHLADEVLTGLLTFTNGSPTVTCSLSLTGVVSAGDWIQAVPGDGPVVSVDSIDGVGTTITLSANYTGSTGSTKAIRRGDSSVLPLSVALPGGSQDFTDWYGTSGGQVTDTIAEYSP